MPFQRSIRTVVAVALLGLVQLGSAATARAADLPKCDPDPTREAVPTISCYTIDPHDTDPQILDTPTPPGTRGNHRVFLEPKASRVGRLLVFLPTGGVNNVPSEFSHLGTEAGRLGYHTILLAYRNEAPIAFPPPAGCGPSPAPNPVSPDCAIQMRLELLEGDGDSSIVDVDRANSIENRLDKLLQYLATNQPDDGWAQFLDTNGQPKWSETVIAGSSLGAGQAAIIAQQHKVYRAALLHGWVDASHGWVTLGGAEKTPSANYFTLIHARENFFARTCPAYEALGLTPNCPLAEFPIPIIPTNPLFIENREPPFGTQMHVFNLTPGSFAGMGDHFHQSTSRDGWIAKEADGVTPSHHLVNAWRSVLGDSDADTRLDEADNCPSTPDPSQADTDGDGVGDVCDPLTFSFAGFFAPVDNGAALNLVKAGNAVPVKFSLGGDRGLEVFAVGSPSSRPISCDTQAPLDIVEETHSPGASALNYDALADRYQYVWKTDAAWSGTCRQLAVRTVDGAAHHAGFKLK
jgi:hypothetical protein